MGCSSCGKSNNNQRQSVSQEPGATAQFKGKVDLMITEYFKGIGWRYVGGCGCRENHSVYVNDSIPQWEVWIHSSGITFQMRRVYSVSDKRKKFVGGKFNYERVYQYALQSEDNLRPTE